jgi:hypothetical protein
MEEDKIQFISEPGVGSLFSLIIPAQVDASAEAFAANEWNITAGKVGPRPLNSNHS